METLDPKSLNYILAGAGGTGGRVLKAVRRRTYQKLPNDEERDKLSIGLAYVDSTREMMTPDNPFFYVMGKDASFMENEFMDIRPVDLKQTLDSIPSYPGLGTIAKNGTSMKNTLGEVGQAVGQKRRAGRILFAADYNKYLSAPERQYNKVKSLTNKDEVNIHILAGLAGGTGSGAIINVVTQTHARKTYKHANTMVCAVVPELDIPARCQAGCYHQNGYAALEKLSALNIGRFVPLGTIRRGEKIELDFTPNKQPDLMPYSNVNENGMVANSFTELPQLLTDTVYFRLLLEEKHGTTDGLLRSFGLENINDLYVGYSEKPEGADKERIRTKTTDTLGIERIIYPGRRILEHIIYTVGEHILWQMQYSGLKDDFGLVQESVRKDYRELYINNKNSRDWLLDDSHSILGEKTLDTDKYRSKVENPWSNITNGYSYDDTKVVDPEPLRFLESICADTYKNAFCNKQGVEVYYQDKNNGQLLRGQAQYITEHIEKNLYTRWHEDTLSLEDLLNICDTVLTYIKDRKKKVKTDIVGVNEKVKAGEDDAGANSYDYNHLSLLQHATERSPCLYSDHQTIMKDPYTLRIRRVAYEFEGKLLGKLRAALGRFSVEVSQFTGVLPVPMDAAEKRIADRNKNTKGIAGLSSAAVEVSEGEKVLKFEQALILNKNQQETWSGNIRKVTTGNCNHTHSSELTATTSEDAIFDISDTELSPEIREKHDQDYQSGEALGLNMLQQLQKVLLTDTDIRNFAFTVINWNGVFLKLDDGQLSKTLSDNEDLVSHPESVNRKTVLISVPIDRGNDSLKAPSNKLKVTLQGAFGNTTPGNAINFNTSSDRMSEIAVTSIRYCFPMHATAWLPPYDRTYSDMVNNKNGLATKEARILLHGEDSDTKLPDLMGERKVSSKDSTPYFFVATANNIPAVRENKREGKGWCTAIADEQGAEMVTLIASQFTELLANEDLTEEVLGAIKEKVDEVLKSPDLKMSDRAAMVEGVKVVMCDYTSKECSSPTSPKYQQYSIEAKKALEIINKK